MENKSYDVARIQPYTTSLQALGATFARSFATSHPSQPNYLALFAGWDINVTSDACPAPGSPYSLENLGHALETSGRTWRPTARTSRSPARPPARTTAPRRPACTCASTRRGPTSNNVNHANERPYSELAADIAANTLPNLVYVIPNNCHNTHNSSTPGCDTAAGDAWLSTRAAAVDRRARAERPADPDLGRGRQRRRATTSSRVFVGPKVQPGFVSNISVSHYTMVRTICDAFGFPTFERATAEPSIANVWKTVTPALRMNWGRLKYGYR